MSIKALIFPTESRSFWGKRWLNVIFRSVHLCGVAGYTGGVFFNADAAALHPWYLLTSLSGLAIMGMDLYSNGKCLLQNRGLFILVKLVILGFLPHLPHFQQWGLMIIIVFSSIISHGTANFRYYSIFHRRQI